MALLEPATNARRVSDHGYHQVRVADVIVETADACSFVLDIPEDLHADFAYESGQFCTFRIWVDEQPYIRCYSMSSAPATDSQLRVTVKRTLDGVVSNWMNDHLKPGDLLEVARPAGFFQLGPHAGDLVAFSAGSGITPVLSLLKTALATTARQVRLLYANRDADAIILRAEIDELRSSHRGRCTVSHHLDVESGFVGAEQIRTFAGAASEDAQFYICGPGPFMDLVEHTLRASGVDEARIHIERFTPAEPPPEDDAAVEGTATTSRVTIALNGRTDSVDHHPGTTILQTARQMGMAPPFSCEMGSCATCMAMLREGTVTMHVNNALTPDEVEEGWVLTCQSVPTSPSVTVVYE
jgi:3-ketosteroid 9alpha-monooxygenase subunit B